MFLSVLRFANCNELEKLRKDFILSGRDEGGTAVCNFVYKEFQCYHTAWQETIVIKFKVETSLKRIAENELAVGMVVQNFSAIYGEF